jgi:hypothetical protein
VAISKERFRQGDLRAATPHFPLPIYFAGGFGLHLWPVLTMQPISWPAFFTP